MTKRHLRYFLIVLLAQAAAVPVHAESDPVMALVRVGKPLFNQHCASCHGRDARGDGPTARALRAAPPDLTAIAKRNNGEFPTGEIMKKIDGRLGIDAHGTREMPVWGATFSKGSGGGSFGEENTRGKLVVLVEYLKSIQR